MEDNYAPIDEQIRKYLKENLSIRTEWYGWEYHSVSNTLTIKLLLENVEIDQTSVCISPVSYEI